MNCVNACNDIDLLNILSIFKSLIGLVTIIVPVILVIFVIIDIIKTITAGDVDTKKLAKSISCASKSNVLQISINNAQTAISDLSQAISNLKANPNQTTYDEAYRLYEVARKEVNDITGKSEREAYQETLADYKDDLESYREDIKNN